MRKLTWKPPANRHDSVGSRSLFTMSVTLRGYFADFRGISTDHDIPMTTIRIRAYGLQVRYLRSLPLHHSQKEIQTAPDGGWAIFEYRLRPSWDFTSTVLSRMDQMEVLSPASLREDIRNRIRQMAGLYEYNLKQTGIAV